MPLIKNIAVFGKILPPLLAALACAGQAQTNGTQVLRAGASMVDITPDPSKLQFKTDSIRDHLFARAIVVDSGGSCTALVGLDLGGVPKNLYDMAAAKVATATGCPKENILISATHTHSGSANATVVADAIVKAATEAKAKLAPAKVGYGRTTVDLNVNRDLYNSKQEWRQAPNVQGVSDKTLSVIEFIGADYIPIGVYMTYAMHPINFYLSGVTSADFPGEASRAIEEHFDHKAVAIFTQGTSGDQNPILKEPFFYAYRAPNAPGTEKIGEPPPPPTNFNPGAAASALTEVPAESMEAYKKHIARTGADVTMMGWLIAEKALYLMRNDITAVPESRVWGGQESFTCPGRDRLDTANPIRENGMPPYKDGADVNLMVSLVRIGDISIVGVNGEVYANIGLKLKSVAPANKLVVSTLTNGGANSGYIYSDDAYSHLSFQVIGSRLKPGCAENKIVHAALDLMSKAEN